MQQKNVNAACEGMKALKAARDIMYKKFLLTFSSQFIKLIM